jgi:hypothetical protein
MLNFTPGVLQLLFPLPPVPLVHRFELGLQVRKRSNNHNRSLTAGENLAAGEIHGRIARIIAGQLEEMAFGHPEHDTPYA